MSRLAILAAAIAALTLSSGRAEAAIVYDSINFATDTIADGTGTGTLANGTINVTYSTVATAGVSLAINWNTNQGTGPGVGPGGVNHLTAGRSPRTAPSSFRPSRSAPPSRTRSF